MSRLGSWHSPDYAAQWAGEDVVAGLLELPRRLSAAIVSDSGIAVRHVVDLGSGPGAYLELLLDEFPAAHGTWVDSSEAMLGLAQERLSRFGGRVAYLVHDVERLEAARIGRADVVVSSRVLHHLSPELLAAAYRAAFELLEPGGFLFNLDHVGAPGDWGDVLRRVRRGFTGDRARELRPHRHDYPLAPVDRHLAWARQAGFRDPDVPWRAFTTALVAARRPA